MRLDRTTLRVKGGDLQGHVHVCAVGQSKIDLRRQLAAATAEDLETWAMQQLKSRHPHAELVDGPHLSGAKADLLRLGTEDTLHIEFDFEIVEFLGRDGTATMPSRLLAPRSRNPFGNKPQRDSPLWFPAASGTFDEVTLEIPKGMSLVNPPTDRQHRTESLFYRVHTEASQDHMRWTRLVATPRGTMEPEDVMEMQKVFARIQAEEGKHVRLAPMATTGAR
jgi:hypothetical protein